MATPFLRAQPISIYPRVPPFPALVSIGKLFTCALLFVSIPVVCSLIELPLVQYCPSNHGLPIEVEFPVIFPHHGTYVHDGPSVIPVLSLDLA
jgi:hypothetical protein